MGRLPKKAALLSYLMKKAKQFSFQRSNRQFIFSRFPSSAIKANKLFKRLHKVFHSSPIKGRAYCSNLHKDVMSFKSGILEPNVNTRKPVVSKIPSPFKKILFFLRISTASKVR